MELANTFSGLKVVEIASVLAGPSVGMFFSELGANVIKVENKKTGGDVTRSWKLPNEQQETNVSAYFSSVNWNKTYLFLDLSNPSDYNTVLELIKEADILIANFKFGDALKFGLDYQKISAINTQIIYGEITGFGSQSDRVAYDLILQAETGFMAMNGTPTSGPIKMPVALIDILAGHQLKEGILTALYAQHKSKHRSFHITVSLYDSAIASLANQASNYLMAQHVAQPIGSTHPNIAPYGELFETKDHKQITFAIGSDKQFKKLCLLLNGESLLLDDAFKSNSKRVENRIILAKKMQELIAKYEAQGLIEACHHSFVPVAQIKRIDEVFEADAAQNLVLEENIEGVLTRRVKTAVFKALD